jgi:hypothetical protein
MSKDLQGYSRKHLEAVTPDVSNGKVTLGGALMKDTWKDGETPPMIGSFMLIYAESKEEVIERLRADIYSTAGAWDVDKLQIWPVKTAVRAP